MMNNLGDWLCQARKAKRMALIAHVSPDGDTVGATLALRLAFLSLGKEVDIVCDGVPGKSLPPLEGMEAFIPPDQARDDYDTAIAVDVSDHRLLGRADRVFDSAPMRMVIDHHATNPGYGMVNYIRGDECSCCVLAHDVIEGLGVTVNREMGECLMTGMSTDTGHFMYPYTTPRAFELAAKLLRLGVDISALTRVLYRLSSRERVALMRIAYQKLRFELDGQVGVIELTEEDLASAGCTANQTEGLVNKALEVEGVRMAILATPREDGVKLSLRAVEPDTVNDLAKRFGGGGHAQAAGVTMHMTMEEAVSAMLSAMAEKLDAAGLQNDHGM
ncbi:MAG: DHH family phosphoesterase [Clostridia bacterium]|nr:DHH family phosphoesterase [Clostridia bacterium]